jgi:hypothetical protein
MGLIDIFTTFKGFFSRTFWFGSFLPVAIFAGIHLLVASWLGTGIDLASLISADSNKVCAGGRRLRGDPTDSAGEWLARRDATTAMDA